MPKQIESTMIAAAFALAATLNVIVPAHANLIISSGMTHKMSCRRNVCTAFAKDAVLNVGDLESMLAAGSVKVRSGTVAPAIEVEAPVAWSSASTLTLDAFQSVIVDKKVTVTGTGGFAIITNDRGTSGVFAFAKSGSVRFSNLSSSLVIDRSSYALVGDIQNLANAISQNSAGFYALANDYDASGDGTYPSAPIATTFAGTFEGLGNHIFNLAINDQNQNDSVGLFAQTGQGSALSNLRLVNVSISATYGFDVGAVVGNNNSRAISGTSVSGSVNASSGFEVGGLAGISSGTISSSFSSASVAGGNSAGGLVGENEGTISGSGGNASVVATGDGGGLVGQNIGTLDDSFADGNVSNTGGYGSQGGLAGYNDGTIDQSFATGSVTGEDHSYVGGLVGYHDNGTIADCYSTGAVTGGSSSAVGGLIGYKIDGLGTSYSTGAVVGGSGSTIGGLVGIDATQNGYNNVDDYWDTETSGITNPSQGAGNVLNDGGITGLSTEEFQSGLPTGFSAAVWVEKAKENDRFPYLLANHPAKN